MHTMKHTNSGLPDLNLLRVFLAIWDLRSLTAAGERLGLTQPAVSHTLRRLREQFDDPLFVRTPQTMVPTEAAVRLHGPLDEAFGIIMQAVQAHGRFDAASASRVFRVSMSDMSEFFFLPPLLAALDRSAPGIRFEIVPLPAESVGAAMRAGELDLALGYVPGLGDGCVSDHLFDDEHVCLLRTGHPLAARKVMKEDLAVIFPRSIAERLNRARIFRLLKLPFDLPPIDVRVHTHARFASDAGIRWLRTTLIEMFAERA